MFKPFLKDPAGLSLVPQGQLGLQLGLEPFTGEVFWQGHSQRVTVILRSTDLWTEYKVQRHCAAPIGKGAAILKPWKRAQGPLRDGGAPTRDPCGLFDKKVVNPSQRGADWRVDFQRAVRLDMKGDRAAAFGGSDNGWRGNHEGKNRQKEPIKATPPLYFWSGDRKVHLMTKAQETTPSVLPPDIAKLSFEEAMAELEKLVRQLEDGRAKLDDAIGAYERGALLKRHCESKLREAQARIEKITVLDNGEVQTSPFNA